MAWVTQALPVGAVPEQHHVTSVRDDVINVRRSCHTPLLLAVLAQRVLGEEARSRLLPAVVVAALAAGAALLLRYLVLGRGGC